MRVLIILFVLVLISSCKSKQPMTKSTIVETSRSSISYVLPTSNSFEINSLCDSISGKPKDFKAKIKTGTGDIDVESKDNKFKFIYKTDTIVKDSIVIKEVFVDKYKLDIIYKTPKIWYYISGVLLLGWVFPAIPRFVNGVFKKLVGMF